MEALWDVLTYALPAAVGLLGLFLAGPVDRLVDGADAYVVRVIDKWRRRHD